MKHVGDITKLNGAELEPVDVVTGGSPCQNLSIAGNRKGLAGEQSALFFEQIRVIREMREADAKRGRSGQFVRPRFCVWENVPGALSSNGGRDFQKVLSEFVRIKEPDAPDVPMPQRWPMAGCLYGDGWSLAWRVHDAQFWGVPQRRKRIALVVDFGGRAAPEVLFEPHRLSWDSAAGGDAGKEAAGGAGSGTAEAGGLTNRGSATGYIAETLRANPHGSYPMVANALTRRFDGSPQPDKGTGNVVATYRKVSSAFSRGQGDKARGIGWQEEIAPSLKAEVNGNNPPAVVAYRIGSDHSYGMLSGNPNSGFPQVDVSCTIDASDQRPERHQGGIAIVSCYDARGNGGGKVVSTITGDHAGHISDYTPLCVGNGQLHQVAMSEQANTLDTMHDQQCVLENLTVRRLTPLECERLQGFPDGWTDIGDYTDENGKPRHTSDSARYRAMGNSIALPFWFWLLRRISALYERPATLGSLFDGVGGFPLCWERCNGSGTARWASEIEPFCVAVTKRRFGEE